MASSTRTASGSRVTCEAHRSWRRKTGTPFDYVQATLEGRGRVTSQYRGIIVPTKSGLKIVVGHSIDEIIVFDRTLVTTLCTGLALTILLAVGCGAAR